MARTPETIDATPQTGTAVLDIQAEIAKEMALIKKTVSAPGGNRISTRGKEFKLPNGSKDAGPMTVVILDFMTHNLFYTGRFDPKNPSPPSCFAIGKEIDAMVPSPNSPDKQSEDCPSCPMNQFGSSGNGKACKNTRVLAVVAPNDDDSSPIMTISVPPMSLKDYDKYVNDTARRFSLPPVGVLTEISFDEAADFEKLLFKAVGPNENLKLHWGRKAEAVEILSVEPNLTAREPAKPAGKPFTPARPKKVA